MTYHHPGHATYNKIACKEKRQFFGCETKRELSLLVGAFPFVMQKRAPVRAGLEYSENTQIAGGADSRRHTREERLASSPGARGTVVRAEGFGPTRITVPIPSRSRAARHVAPKHATCFVDISQLPRRVVSHRSVRQGFFVR